MAAMVSGVWVRVLCIFCLIVVPEAWADRCTSYTDSQDKYHDSKLCEKYCCGKCSNKYCCKNKNERFTEEQQANCPDLTTYTPGTHNIVVVASIIAAVIFILICVCLIICCVAPCCLCYKLCRKPRNQRQIVVTNTAANMPQPHSSPSAYQAHPPGYQAVAGCEGSTLPSTPPPSYRESISPSYSAPFVPEQAMYPLTPPSQPSAPPLPSDEIAQPPYNPTYRPQH
ncbi:protein shisa-5-like [Poeciliopsis prolifica]|uniref:protein shisa-5-like n=1 Tax=Poeciliopsis prolifica TaxID=188132 RepID=UPI00241303E3|nr:protein shisa-5-like [Poeciliopsis prolifica]